MGNQHSSTEGEPELPNATSLLNSPAAIKPNCFGNKGNPRADRSSSNTTNNSSSSVSSSSSGKKGLHFRDFRPTRSQSFKHESSSSSSSNSKFTAFKSDKGRRNSYDIFPQYKANSKEENPTVKGSIAHQRSKSSPVHPEPGHIFSSLEPVLEGIDRSPSSTSTSTDGSSPQTTATPEHNINNNNNSSSSGGSSVKTKIIMSNNNNLEKFAKQLAQISRSMDKSVGDDRISRVAFEKYLVPQSPVGEQYLWKHFVGSSPGTPSVVKSSVFIQGAEKIYTTITDKDQINFYVKLYSQGNETICRSAFIDLLISSYQLSSIGAGKAGRDLKSTSEEFDGKEWIESVTKSCFHIKEEMSTFFVSNWLSTNLPRLVVPMHKYYAQQLGTGHSRMSQMKDSPKLKSAKSMEAAAPPAPPDDMVPDTMGIDPILMWFLLASIPQTYLKAFERKDISLHAPPQVKPLNRMNSRDQLLQLLHNQADSERWSILYSSEDQGLSINRFQHHVFNYRGPTIMIIKADDGYTFMVGVDTEWKESCHFWGGEQCFIIQLKPEFRYVERGGKSLFANFSIRGYPFGLQVGQDPRSVSLEIKPDFEYVYFKKIPCRIQSLQVYGCGSTQLKMAQTEHKKWEAKESEKQKKVNLNAGEWGDNPDKYLLELAGNYKSYGS